MAVAQKNKADVPMAGGFRTLCGACMAPIDSTIYDDANLADEAGEIHPQKLHPGPKNIVSQAWTLEQQYRKKVIANLRRVEVGPAGRTPRTLYSAGTPHRRGVIIPPLPYRAGSLDGVTCNVDP